MKTGWFKVIQWCTFIISPHWDHRTRRHPRTPSDLKRLLLARLGSYCSTGIELLFAILNFFLLKFYPLARYICRGACVHFFISIQLIIFLVVVIVHIKVHFMIFFWIFLNIQNGQDKFKCQFKIQNWAGARLQTVLTFGHWNSDAVSKSLCLRVSYLNFFSFFFFFKLYHCTCFEMTSLYLLSFPSFQLRNATEASTFAGEYVFGSFNIEIIEIKTVRTDWVGFQRSPGNSPPCGSSMGGWRIDIQTSPFS